MLNPAPFITYAFVMSITPGPNNVMLTASGATFGFRRTLPHMLGVVFGFVVQLLAVCAGTLGAVHPLARPADRAELGGGGLPGLPRGAHAAQRGHQAQGKSRPVRFHEAALFQFLNPKAWVMTVTCATLFLPQELGVFLRGAYMATVMEVVGIPCMTAWALFGSSLKNFLAAPRPRMVFNVVMAVALAATAIVMVVK